MTKVKVFIGNLSFKVKESQLIEAFSAAGKVSGANIITRGTRSLGYGFVEMESEEEANEAVKLLNKKEIDGRQINVEVAKPREEGAAGPSTGAAGSPGAEAAGEKRRRAPRAPRAPAAAGQAQSAPAAAGQAQGEQGPDGGRRRNAPRRRGPRGPRSDAAEGQPAAQAAGQPGQRRERQPRAPRAPRPEQGPRNPSTSTLFVANLPFSVTDAGLEALFKGVAVKSAHVVMKKNGRSKGFGFVEFNTEADQRTALQQVDQLDVEGRKLIVKVALTENATGEASAPSADQK